MTPTIQNATPKGVFLWMIELHSRGDMWHQDDNALECFTDQKKARILERERQKAWRICEDNNVDIHLLAITSINMNTGQSDDEAKAEADEVAEATGLSTEEVLRLVSEAGRLNAEREGA